MGSTHANVIAHMLSHAAMHRTFPPEQSVLSVKALPDRVVLKPIEATAILGSVWQEPLRRARNSLLRAGPRQHPAASGCVPAQLEPGGMQLFREPAIRGTGRR